jgi:hypothetical protein
MDGMPGNHTFGFMLNLHCGYGCLQFKSLIPGSFMYDYLGDQHIEGLFLLTINSIKLQSLTDIMAILDDVFDHPEPMTCTFITGFTSPFGKLDELDPPFFGGHPRTKRCHVCPCDTINVFFDRACLANPYQKPRKQARRVR